MMKIILNFCVMFLVACSYGDMDMSGPGCINGDFVVLEDEGQEYGRCNCWAGWRGQKCDLCGGKVELSENMTRYWLADGVGNYTNNMKCTWVVKTNKPGSRIRLHVKAFETECGWDHLYVWDGDNVFHGLEVSSFYVNSR